VTPSQPLPPVDPLDAAPPSRLPAAWGRSDKIVLICGIAAAILAVIYHSILTTAKIPWAQRWILAFPLHWSWLLPLAIAMLADMQSRTRWILALVVYGVALPALSALSLIPLGNLPPVEQRASMVGYELMGTTVLTAMLGFILLPLISAFDSRQPLGNYPQVFRAAWRIAVQGVLAGALSMCVLTLIYLGAKMFAMIGMTFLESLFGETVFWLAAMPVAFAVTLIGIQRRPQLATVLQRSWLTLSAWMLPLASVLGVTFAVALLAQLAFGLRAGTLSAGVLIGFSGVWIKLVNATWQDGGDTAPFGPRLQRVLRWSLYCLLPLAGLALYNVGVRVDQYGWTVSRIWAAFAALLAVIYSLGYLCAALRATRFHAILARTNYVAAFAAIGVLTALNTSLFDPRRITAESQTQRLIDGRLPLEDFEFGLLRSQTDQYGRDALQRLAAGAANERDPRIAELAKRSLAGEYISDSDRRPKVRAMPAMTVFPAGRTVPDDWWPAVEGDYFSDVDGCIDMANRPDAATKPPHCSVIFADLSGTGREDLILYVPAVSRPRIAEIFRVFTKNKAGTWERSGTLARADGIEGFDGFDVAAAKTDDGAPPDEGVSALSARIAAGAVRTAPRTDRDLLIGNTRLQLQ